MDERDGALEARVGEVLEVVAELGRQQHALVGDRAAGHGSGIEARGSIAAVDVVVDRVRDDLADDEEPALELVLVGYRGITPDEGLHVHGLGRQDAFAEAGIVDGDGTPAEECLALIGDDPLDDAHDVVTALFPAGQEEKADSVVARLGEGEAEAPAILRKEGMRDLDEHAATVAGLRVGAHGAAMVEIVQDLQGLRDDGMAGAVLQVGDESDPASVLLTRGIVEALRRREAGIGGNDAGNRPRRVDPCSATALPSLRVGRVHHPPPVRPLAEQAGSSDPKDRNESQTPRSAMLHRIALKREWAFVSRYPPGVGAVFARVAPTGALARL